MVAPKNLLRHKDCKSNLSEFDDEQGHPGFDKQGTRFKRLIKDQNDHSDLEEGIRRLVLCSGKVCNVLNCLFFYIQTFYFCCLVTSLDDNKDLAFYYKLETQKTETILFSVDLL